MGRAQATSRTAAFKVPTRFEVVERLPRSLIGKISHREVRAALLSSATGAKP